MFICRLFVNIYAVYTHQNITKLSGLLLISVALGSAAVRRRKRMEKETQALASVGKKKYDKSEIRTRATFVTGKQLTISQQA